MRYNTIDEILRQQLLNPLQDVDGFRLYNTELQYALLSSIDKIFYSPGTPSTNSPWIPIDISSQGNVLVFSYYAIGNGRVDIYLLVSFIYISVSYLQCFQINHSYYLKDQIKFLIKLSVYFLKMCLMMCLMMYLIYQI